MADRVNQRAGICTECDGEVPAGAGSLWWEAGPDDGGDVVGRTPAGWRVTHLDAARCASTRRERAASAAAEREARRLAREEEDRAQRERLAAQDAAIRALLGGIPDCTSAGYDWSPEGVLEGVRQTSWDGRAYTDYSGEPVSLIALDVPEDPALAGLSLGRSDWSRHRATTGETCYVHAFGNARVLYGPRAVVERAWAARAASWCDRGMGVEEARRWLDDVGPEAMAARAAAKHARGEHVASYDAQPCAGWELRAYVAGRLDLLATAARS